MAKKTTKKNRVCPHCRKTASEHDLRNLRLTHNKNSEWKTHHEVHEAEEIM